MLSMYRSGVYVPECCQCTKVVSMYQSAVNVHEWCLCTRVLSMYQSGVYVTECCMYQNGVYVPECCLYTGPNCLWYLTWSHGRFMNDQICLQQNSISNKFLKSKIYVYEILNLFLFLFYNLYKEKNVHNWKRRCVRIVWKAYLSIFLLKTKYTIKINPKFKNAQAVSCKIIKSFYLRLGVVSTSSKEWIGFQLSWCETLPQNSNTNLRLKKLILFYKI